VNGGEIVRRNVLARSIGALDGQGVIEFYTENPNCNNEYPRNVQMNVSQYHGMKAQKRSTGLPLFILYLDTRRAGVQRNVSALYLPPPPRVRAMASIEQEAGWTRGLVWKIVEKSNLLCHRNLNPVACSPWLLVTLSRPLIQKYTAPICYC